MPEYNFPELIEEAQTQASHTHGQNIYVIRALIPLIQSNKLVVDSNEGVQNAIKSFEHSTKQTEKKMAAIAGVGIFIAIAQFVLAIVIWKGF